MKADYLNPNLNNPIALAPEEKVIEGFGERLERCVIALKPSEELGEIGSAYAVCRASLRRAHSLPAGENKRENPVTNPNMMNWQFVQLQKQLLLLQLHAEDTSCPCNFSDAENVEHCIRKHLLVIEALAEETATMSEDTDVMTALGEIAEEAREYRRLEEDRLHDGKPFKSEALGKWARDKRKALEVYSLMRENPGEVVVERSHANPGHSGPVLCEFAVGEFRDPHTKEKMIFPYFDCPKCPNTDFKCVLIPHIPSGTLISACGYDVNGVRHYDTERHDSLADAEEYVYQLCQEIVGEAP